MIYGKRTILTMNVVSFAALLLGNIAVAGSPTAAQENAAKSGAILMQNMRG